MRRSIRLSGSVPALALFGALGFANYALADTPAFTAPDPSTMIAGVGADSPVNLGTIFQANSAFSVDALGAWYQGSGVPNQSAEETVTLYSQATTTSTSGTQLAQVTFTFTSGSAGYQYAPIPKVSLISGDIYTVSAWVGDNSWAYGPNPTSVSQVTYVASSYVYGGVAFPYGRYFSDTYYGPNFEIAPATTTTPEPGLYGVLLLGLGGLMFAVVRRRKSA